MNTTTGEIPAITSSKPVQRAWAMYDWANSAYNLVITSTIFPIYYEAVTSVKSANGEVLNDTVSFFGIQVKNSSLFDYSISAAYLVIAFLSPILSSVADYRGNKKFFMQLFCYLGSAACCGLYFFKRDTLELGIICSSIAALGYCGSLVFYNAYLPEIAPENERDRLSAQGFSYGYIGSVILQVICFIFVLKPDWFGIKDDSFAPRLSFLLVGIWWFGFAQITFFKLPKGVALPTQPSHGVLANGFIELKKVWAQLKQMPVLKTYLGAFFFYSMGVQTVMLAAALFGSKELKLEQGQLITTILIIQLVAIAGAYLMAKLAATFGNLKVLLFVLFIWVGICVGAYFVKTAMEFYVLATVVGIVMGGIQSLSRSTYSKLMPVTHDTASFFSFYDVTEKLAIVIGMMSFGFIDSLMDMRAAILALITFFVAGALILYIAIRRQTAQKMAVGH
ncbi:MFS transporter [Flavipsychrobacter stenotrophus]|uniref:MFS transporter n=1 Tax=Flavipsychrobacter stenotrophus TaxID=2077091 RepID=A0A2S7STJ8_9BACT|nr:MFS transporter [Flavipsychrobacter stenotrophus]PQJ09941.1 MFS transporter [Flavipsychrobacter stenotrophus]